MICSLCSIIQGLLGSQEHPVINTLSRFALQRNAAAILDMNEKKGNFPSIHGIRSISMAWVVLGHQYLQQSRGTTINIMSFGNVSASSFLYLTLKYRIKYANILYR